MAVPLKISEYDHLLLVLNNSDNRNRIIGEIHKIAYQAVMKVIKSRKLVMSANEIANTMSRVQFSNGKFQVL